MKLASARPGRTRRLLLTLCAAGTLSGAALTLTAGSASALPPGGGGGGTGHSGNCEIHQQYAEDQTTDLQLSAANYDAGVALFKEGDYTDANFAFQQGAELQSEADWAGYMASLFHC